MAPAEQMEVEVVCSPRAGAVLRKHVSLKAGACVRDALQASGLFDGTDLAGWALGVWGTLRSPDDLLRDRDRVEVYRPLRVDPKEARRQRHRTQRAPAGR